MNRKSSLKQDRESRGKQYSGLDNFLLVIVQIGIYLTLLTPLVVHNKFLFPFVAPKGFYLMALVEIVFFSWAILVFRRPEFRPNVNNIFKAFVVFIIVLILSTILSTDISESFWSKPERMTGLLMWLHLFVLYLVVSSVFKKKDWLKIFMASLIVAVIVCLFFLLEKLGIQGLPVGLGGSTIGNSSFLGTYLLFNLFFAIYLFKKMKGLRILISLAFIVLLLTLMFSTARAAIIVFFAGFVLLVLLLLLNTSYRRVAKLMLIVGFVAYIIGLGLFNWYSGPVHEWLTQFMGRSRQAVWESAWHGFEDKPLLGWGMGNFSFVFHRYFNSKMYLSDEYGPNTRFDRAHNILLDTLVDSGILGLISYITLYIIILLECVKNYTKLGAMTASVPIVILTTHFTQNMTVFDTPVSFLMMILVFAFVSSAGANQREGKSNYSPIIPVVSVVLLVICFIYFIIFPVRACTNTIGVFVSQTYEQREPYYIRAFESSPFGQNQIRVRMGNLLEEMHPGDSRDYKIVTNYLEQEIRDNEYDYFARLTLGRILRLYSQYDNSQLLKAEKVLIEAIQLSPSKQEVYWELAKVESRLGNQDMAYALLDSAIMLEPKTLNSHRLMLLFLIDIGQTDLASQKLEEAKGYIPTFVDELDSIYQVALDKKQGI